MTKEKATAREENSNDLYIYLVFISFPFLSFSVIIGDGE